MELDSIPAQIGLQMALNQQNLQIGLLKRTAQTEQQIASILETAVTASSRGGRINTTA